MSEKTLSKTSIDSSVNNQFAILLALAEKDGKVVAGQGGSISFGRIVPNAGAVSSFFGARGYHADIGIDRETNQYFVRLSPPDDKTKVVETRVAEVLSVAREVGSFVDGIGGRVTVDYDKLPVSYHPGVRSHLSSLGYECDIQANHQHGNPKLEITIRAKRNDISQMINRLNL